MLYQGGHSIRRYHKYEDLLLMTLPRLCFSNSFQGGDYENQPQKGKNTCFKSYISLLLTRLSIITRRQADEAIVQNGVITPKISLDSVKKGDDFHENTKQNFKLSTYAMNLCIFFTYILLRWQRAALCHRTITLICCIWLTHSV